MERSEKERRAPREREYRLAWCSVVIINPQWLTRLRTFMIHANGSATRSTRSRTYIHVHRFNTRAYRMPFERALVWVWMRMHVCVHLWLSATQISLCVPPRLKSLDLPFSLARRALVTKASERASVHPFNGFLELETKTQTRRNERASFCFLFTRRHAIPEIHCYFRRRPRP